MNKQLIFNFRTDIAGINIPLKLNNPFGVHIPEIARIASSEFQEFIALESEKWKYDFRIQKGKMFGILVVQREENTYSYIGTVSGKLPGNAKCDEFIPSIFDDSVGDFFINKGMSELTEINSQIKIRNNPLEIALLKENRRQKSIALQERLFENYNILNLSGKSKNLLEIFRLSSYGKPPSAAGECVAPKLLQYAIRHGLKPIALAEFWWGNPINNKERQHNIFYPACKSRCRPILEYMLEDTNLFDRCNEIINSDPKAI
ncbi:MAG: tRNA pseudouridine32 synthase/23S rRNA pseudouridine746 synthase [Saprospiraceae bacterium]|jgi:tRNA pseudouridine32 synthase/23S rRNA pseudouridine746 synthase